MVIMAENSKIEWTHHTFNPWLGCTKISPACDHCYAEGWAKRSGMVEWGPHAERRRTSAANWYQPIKWNRQAEIQFNAWNRFKADHPDLTDAQLVEAGFVKPERPRVFCASLADVFDNAVLPAWRSDLFALIRETPYLEWLLLTKRIGNVVGMSDRAGGWPANAALGFTVCNQDEVNRDWRKAQSAKNQLRPHHLFVSIEPLLGPINLSAVMRSSPDSDWTYRDDALTGLNATKVGQYRDERLDHVIVGGESGSKARPMHPQWARDLRDQCKAAGVPFLFKQWGEWTPGENVCRRTGTVSSATWFDERWLAVMVESLGEWFDVEPLKNGEHQVIDPIAELGTMVPAEKIVVGVTRS